MGPLGELGERMLISRGITERVDTQQLLQRFQKLLTLTFLQSLQLANYVT